MKKVIGLGLLLSALSVGGTALAQSAPQIDRHVAEMRRFLHLSGQQAGAIRADYFAASDEKRLIARNPNIRPFEKKQKMREISRATEVQVSQILNPRQLAKWHGYGDTRPWF